MFCFVFYGWPLTLSFEMEMHKIRYISNANLAFKLWITYIIILTGDILSQNYFDISLFIGLWLTPLLSMHVGEEDVA